MLDKILMVKKSNDEVREFMKAAKATGRFGYPIIMTPIGPRYGCWGPIVQNPKAIRIEVGS